jgi:quinol monooxygenase YgiN
MQSVNLATTQSVFISVTRLRLRSARFLPFFLWHAFRSNHQSRKAEGNLKTSLFRDANRAFWTVTAWRSEAQMRAFMMSGAHHRAIPKLVKWCDEASVVHWLQEGDVLPTIQAAHHHMVTAGRASKLRYPSADHLAFRIAKPVG